jgi:hypothetical protein
MNKACRVMALIGIGLGVVHGVTAGTTLAQAEKAAPAATVPAEQQPSRAQLDNLFEVMRVREQLATMTKLMPQLMQQQFTEQFKQMEKDHPEMAGATDEQRQAVAKIMGKYMERVMNLYTGDEMLDDMAALYQKHLTSSDVDGMIGFYSSPAGQHTLDMVPVIMKEFMPTVMKKVQERVQPAIDEMSKEMEAYVKSQTPAESHPEAK